MSQPHYEYPTRNTWVGYQATNKQEHVLPQAANKMQDLSHVATQAEWRQYTGEPFFSQCQYSCQYKERDQKHDITSAPISPEPSLPEQKPQIGSSTSENGPMDAAKLQEYLISHSTSTVTSGIQPLSPTSTSDLVTSSPNSDTKDSLMMRSIRSPTRDMMCSSPPASSRCTAAPASSTVSPHSPVSTSDIAGIGKAKKKRKPRTCFSVGQMLVLENTFQQTKYVSITDRGKLAGSLGLTDSQIKVWFQNRRSKWRKTMDSKDRHGNLRHMNSDQAVPPSQQFFWPNAPHHHQDYHVPTTANPEHLYNGYGYRHMVG